MSAMERAYRIDIVAQDTDGAWAVLAWQATDPNSGATHEAACHWTTTLGEARQTWQQLAAGNVPTSLYGSLDGWAGLVLSGVQVWRRFRRADGWGPWERHAPAVDGTHEIRTGVCASAGADPRQDAA